MGLDLTKTPVISKKKENELRSAFDILAEVEAYLEKELGVGEYKQPKTVPPDMGEELADKADALENDQLAVLHAQYVAYASFLNSRLARVKAAYKVADVNLKRLHAEMATKLFTENVAKSEVPDRIRTQAMYQEFELEYLKLYAMKEILSARYESYDEQAKSISRLITLRTEEMQTQRMNIQKRGQRGQHRRLG